jgi:hypothetical protein
VIAIATVITKEICGAVVGGDQKVEVAVVVEIRICGSTPNDGTIKGGAHRSRHVRDVTIAKIAKQQWRLPIVHLGLHAADLLDRPTAEEGASSKNKPLPSL